MSTSFIISSIVIITILFTVIKMFSFHFKYKSSIYQKSKINQHVQNLFSNFRYYNTDKETTTLSSPHLTICLIDDVGSLKVTIEGKNPHTKVSFSKQFSFVDTTPSLDIFQQIDFYLNTQMKAYRDNNNCPTKSFIELENDLLKVEELGELIGYYVYEDARQLVELAKTTQKGTSEYESLISEVSDLLNDIEMDILDEIIYNKDPLDCPIILFNNENYPEPKPSILIKELEVLFNECDTLIEHVPEAKPPNSSLLNKEQFAVSYQQALEEKEQ